ncbi:MAG TPA: NAD-dependent epimerase [bacterium]|nr:NAD-dependent epimerase [bacterium]
MLVTGAAGFIGFHITKRLLSEGHDVVGIDNLNDYYDVTLKESRLAILSKDEKFEFLKMDLADRGAMEKLFNEHEFSKVYHMAAQAGVRYSIDNPHVYVQSNLVGFLHILEGCRKQWTKDQKLDAGSEKREKSGSLVSSLSPLASVGRHLIYASSSSVYGSNTKLPFSTSDNVDHPISLYAATKKANELMAHTYSHLYGIPTTGLRFFTVYGPWGRPDMALFKFTKRILAGEPIKVFNEGHMKRDFTYIDDIVEGVLRVGNRFQVEQRLDSRSEKREKSGSLVSSLSPLTSDLYKVYNIGNNNPVELLDFIKAIEDKLGKKAKMELLPMQRGDVPATYADVDDLMRDVGFKPSTSIRDGIDRFIDWYLSYYV